MMELSILIFPKIGLLILSQKDLGSISLQAHVDGKIDTAQLTQCIAQADIHHIEYRGYTYKDIHFAMIF